MNSFATTMATPLTLLSALLMPSSTTVNNTTNNAARRRAAASRSGSVYTLAAAALACMLMAIVLVGAPSGAFAQTPRPRQRADTEPPVVASRPDAVSQDTTNTTARVAARLRPATRGADGRADVARPRTTHTPPYTPRNGESEGTAGMRIVSRIGDSVSRGADAVDLSRHVTTPGYCQEQGDECSATEMCCDHLTCDTDLSSDTVPKGKVCKDWCEFRYRNPVAEYNKIKGLIVNRFPEERAEICECECGPVEPDCCPNPGCGPTPCEDKECPFAPYSPQYPDPRFDGVGDKQVDLCATHPHAKSSTCYCVDMPRKGCCCSLTRHSNDCECTGDGHLLNKAPGGTDWGEKYDTSVRMCRTPCPDDADGNPVEGLHLHGVLLSGSIEGVIDATWCKGCNPYSYELENMCKDDVEFKNELGIPNKVCLGDNPYQYWTGYPTGPDALNPLLVGTWTIDNPAIGNDGKCVYSVFLKEGHALGQAGPLGANAKSNACGFSSWIMFSDALGSTVEGCPDGADLGKCDINADAHCGPDCGPDCVAKYGDGDGAKCDSTNKCCPPLKCSDGQCCQRRDGDCSENSDCCGNQACTGAAGEQKTCGKCDWSICDEVGNSCCTGFSCEIAEGESQGMCKCMGGDECTGYGADVPCCGGRVCREKTAGDGFTCEKCIKPAADGPVVTLDPPPLGCWNDAACCHGYCCDACSFSDTQQTFPPQCLCMPNFLNHGKDISCPANCASGNEKMQVCESNKDCCDDLSCRMHTDGDEKRCLPCLTDTDTVDDVYCVRHSDCCGEFKCHGPKDHKRCSCVEEHLKCDRRVKCCNSDTGEPRVCRKVGDMHVDTTCEVCVDFPPPGEYKTEHACWDSKHCCLGYCHDVDDEPQCKCIPLADETDGFPDNKCNEHDDCCGDLTCWDRKCNCDKREGETLCGDQTCCPMGQVCNGSGDTCVTGDSCKGETGFAYRDAGDAGDAGCQSGLVVGQEEQNLNQMHIAGTPVPAIGTNPNCAVVTALGKSNNWGYQMFIPFTTLDVDVPFTVVAGAGKQDLGAGTTAATGTMKLKKTDDIWEVDLLTLVLKTEATGCVVRLGDGSAVIKWGASVKSCGENEQGGTVVYPWKCGSNGQGGGGAPLWTQLPAVPNHIPNTYVVKEEDGSTPAAADTAYPSGGVYVHIHLDVLFDHGGTGDCERCPAQ